ncbi:MAG: hypothetical protein KAT34_00595 [Candidatus Aminicenantes bacterium]|nr:hypothetical protein [Candidatus Aminicenantes bacterium]
MSLEKCAPLTKMVTSAIISTAGETEAGSAGEQPARDDRLGCAGYTFRGAYKLPSHFYYSLYTNNRNCPNALRKRTLAAGKLITKTCKRFFHFTLNQYKIPKPSGWSDNDTEEQTRQMSLFD